MIDQADKRRFFGEIFLMANVNPNVILGIPFLTLNSADDDFLKEKFL